MDIPAIPLSATIRPQWRRRLRRALAQTVRTHTAHLVLVERAAEVGVGGAVSAVVDGDGAVRVGR